MYFLFGTHKLEMLKSNVVLILFKHVCYMVLYIYTCINILYTAHAEPFRDSESPLYPSEVQIYFNAGLNRAFSLISVCTVCPDLSVDKCRIVHQYFCKMFQKSKKLHHVLWWQVEGHLSVGRRRGGNDKEFKRILQKLAPSWTVLGKYYGKNLRRVVRTLNMKNGYKCKNV